MTEQQLKDLLADMSLEEKIGQMVQLTANFYGTDMLITGPMGSAKIEPEDMKLCGTILGTSGAAKLKEIQDNAMATQPHHIPMLFMLDVINGFQTIFPIPLAQGCSFEPEIARKGAQIAAKEAAASFTPPRLTFNNITCFIVLPPVQLWASLSSRSDNL